ncbi:MAG: PaaI family thioesterase, partial [Acidobacteriota bacterium]
LIGFSLVEVEPDRAVMRLEVDDRHTSPLGTLHGGILCDIADGAMGCAWATRLAEGESYTTLELKINFLRPVWKGVLHAEAKVVRGGKTVGLIEARVTDEEGRLMAFATSTCMTLRGEKASGR